MSEEALDETRRLLSLAIGPGASTAAKREFQENLIGLPSHASFECKRYFGTLISRFFADFDDLQDKIVDAVLDLCEDNEEQTRLIGIKGLGTTAKADPRWVRGNAGVLLQLLECPPRELKQVKEVLHLLLSISPVDVFAVMADDCRGSEAETGASRRNILDYIRYDAIDVRRDVLELGRSLPAEKAFREGFTAVLGSTPSAESMVVLELLIPLSTISGKNASIELSSAFCETLTKALPPRSSKSATQPLVRLFEDFVSRRPPISAQTGLAFFEKHGDAIEQLARDGDRAAVRLLEQRRKWQPPAAARRASPPAAPRGLRMPDQDRAGPSSLTSAGRGSSALDKPPRQPRSDRPREEVTAPKQPRSERAREAPAIPIQPRSDRSQQERAAPPRASSDTRTRPREDDAAPRQPRSDRGRDQSVDLAPKQPRSNADRSDRNTRRSRSPRREEGPHRGDRSARRDSPRGRDDSRRGESPRRRQSPRRGKSPRRRDSPPHLASGSARRDGLAKADPGAGSRAGGFPANEARKDTGSRDRNARAGADREPESEPSARASKDDDGSVERRPLDDGRGRVKEGQTVPSVAVGGGRTANEGGTRDSVSAANGDSRKAVGSTEDATILALHASRGDGAPKPLPQAGKGDDASKPLPQAGRVERPRDRVEEFTTAGEGKAKQMKMEGTGRSEASQPVSERRQEVGSKRGVELLSLLPAETPTNGSAPYMGQEGSGTGSAQRGKVLLGPSSNDNTSTASSSATASTSSQPLLEVKSQQDRVSSSTASKDPETARSITARLDRNVSAKDAGAASKPPQTSGKLNAPPRFSLELLPSNISRELLPSSATASDHSSLPVFPATTIPQASSSRSLVDRLGKPMLPSPPPSNTPTKRPREQCDAGPTPNGAASLLSRMSGRGDGVAAGEGDPGQMKRLKEMDPPGTGTQAKSLPLRDRIRTTKPIPQDAVSPASQLKTSQQDTRSQPPTRIISINRSDATPPPTLAAPSPTLPAMPAPPAPASTPGLSIKDRSKSATPQPGGISILHRATSSGTVPTLQHHAHSARGEMNGKGGHGMEGASREEAVAEEEIVYTRKGRGFYKPEDEDGDVLMTYAQDARRPSLETGVGDGTPSGLGLAARLGPHRR